MAMDGSGVAVEKTVLSESQRAVLQKYLIGEESGWEDIAHRVACFVASLEKTPELQREWQEKFYSVLAPMKLVPGGSILANSNHGTHGLLNCFVLSAEDNIQDIARLVTDAILTTKFRGGVGINIGAEGQKGYIRPTGSPFADGKSLGPCAVLDMVSETSKKITTGNKARRGAFLFSMHWRHPDIHEFIQAKTQSVMDASTARSLIEQATTLAVDTQLSIQEKNERLAELKTGLTAAWTETHLSPDGKRDRRWQNANISVQVDDEFFRRLDQGDPEVSDLWQKIAQFAHDTADPGLLFADNAKRRSPIRDFITTTNPCVTADAWIHTGDGPRQVKDLVGIQHSTYVNGELFSTTREGFYATGTKPVFRLQTREGYRLRLTANHRVLKVTAQTRHRQYSEWVPADQLQPGDRIMLHDHRNLQPWEGDDAFEESQILGHLEASTGTGKRAASQSLLSDALNSSLHGSAVVTTPTMESLSIPAQVERASFQFYRRFLRNLFDVYGSIEKSTRDGICVKLSQANLATLESVQRMLARLGIVSRIRRVARRLVIVRDNVQRFHNLIGFEHPERANQLVSLLKTTSQVFNQERFTATVEALVPDGVEAVYDCTVPGPSRFDANGLVVHNCGEIWLPPNSACNLGSIVISRFVKQTRGEVSLDWADLARTVEISIRFLDNVLDMAEFATEAQRHNVRNVYRQLGLGIMGWADWLKLRRLPYDTEEHIEEIDRVGRFIADCAYRASEANAAEKGTCGIWPQIKDVITGNPFERWTDEAGNVYRGDEIASLDVPVYQTPRRNATVLSIAPTGSIAQLAACSWAFEPDFGLTIWKQVYVDASRAQQNWVQILNPYLEDLHLNEADTHIVMQTGSLQGTEFAQHNPEVAAAFRISREISWEWHVLAQAAWQKWVDSSISKTINCGRQTGVEQIKEMYRFAERNGLKGVTVYREGTLESEPVKVGAIDANESVVSGTGDPIAPPAHGNDHTPPTPLALSEARPSMLDEEVSQAAALIGIQYDEGPAYLAEETPLDGWHSSEFVGGCGGGLLHWQVWQRENGHRLLVVRSDSYSMCYVKN